MKILMGFAFGVSILAGFSQPMLLDDSFAPMVVREGGGVRVLDVQADGKIVVGGDFQATGVLPRSGLARLNVDGSADATFRAPAVSNVFAMVRLNNGQIVVGGRFDFVGRTQKAGLARFEGDGQLDPSFDAQLNPGAQVTVLAVQDDGKFLVAGTFSSFGGVPRRSIARLHPDGALDTTFDPGSGIITGFISAIGTLSQGKVLVGGAFTSFNGTQIPHLVRLNSDGGVDGSFVTGLQSDSGVYAIAPTLEGKLMIGGYLHLGESQQYVARLNEDGTWDSTFAATNINNAVTRLMFQGDKVMVAGWFYPGLARLNGDGSPDPSFNAGDAGAFVHSMVNLPNGQLLVGNDFSQLVGPATNILVRLNPDGGRDATFNPTFGNIGEVRSVAIGKDRKITFLGDFTHVNGVRRGGLARVHHDGSLDASFNPPNPFYAAAFCLREDASYYALQGSYLMHVGRDGSTVTTPLSGHRLFQQFVIKEQPDGKVLIAGSKYHNSLTTPIQRYWPNGIEDTNFAPLFEPSQLPSIMALHFEAGGRMFIGGGFSSINGVPRKQVARLNEDGTLNESFDPGDGANLRVRSAVRLPDGSYIVGGDFDKYGGFVCGRIARLFPSGAFDASFSPGFGFDDRVYSVELQSDGKIIVGGEFTSYNASLVSHIARLDSNGQADPAFHGHGADLRVNDVEVAPNGDFIIAGVFTEVDGQDRFGLARYLRLPRVTIEREGNGCRLIHVRGPEDQAVILEMSFNLSDWLPIYTNTATTGVLQYADCEMLGRSKFFRAVMSE